MNFACQYQIAPTMRRYAPAIATSNPRTRRNARDRVFFGGGIFIDVVLACLTDARQMQHLQSERSELRSGNLVRHHSTKPTLVQQSRRSCALYDATVCASRRFCR